MVGVGVSVGVGVDVATIATTIAATSIVVVVYRIILYMFLPCGRYYLCISPRSFSLSILFFPVFFFSSVRCLEWLLLGVVASFVKFPRARVCVCVGDFNVCITPVGHGMSVRLMIFIGGFPASFYD